MEFNLDMEEIKKLNKDVFKDGFSVEETEEKTIRKIRKCKECRRPVLGHKGKFGKGKCQYKKAEDKEVQEIVNEIMKDEKYKKLREEDENEEIAHELEVEKSELEVEKSGKSDENLLKMMLKNQEMQLQQSQMNMKQTEKMTEMADLLMNMQKRMQGLEDENEELSKTKNPPDQRFQNNYDNNKAKCPKWKKNESIESYENMVKIWDKLCTLDPGLKLIQFMDAIEEDHSEAYRRLKLETIDKKNFDCGKKTIIEECLEIL